MLRSRRFFRHQDCQNRLMSHFDVICVIWHQMSYYDAYDAYDAYDIKICHKSIWPILVSKEASGPQLLQQLVILLLINCFKIVKFKSRSGNFFLYKYLRSFVFSGRKMGILRQHVGTPYDFEISHGISYTQKEWD